MVWLDAGTYLNSYKEKGKTLKNQVYLLYLKMNYHEPREGKWLPQGYFIVLAIKSN